MSEPKKTKRPPMTVPEACEYLKKSKKTIYRLVNRGLIGASTKLRHLMLNRDDVENLGAP